MIRYLIMIALLTSARSALSQSNCKVTSISDEGFPGGMVENSHCEATSKGRPIAQIEHDTVCMLRLTRPEASGLARSA
jgi:hypothetical protein